MRKVGHAAVFLWALCTPAMAVADTQCPTAADLRDGIVVTDKGWNAGDMFFWRQLGGEVFGTARPGSGLLLSNRINLWHADLVELTQVTATGNRVWSADRLEGLDGLMQMLPGTSHTFSYRQSLGREDSLLRIEHEWQVRFADAGTVYLGGCSYPQVKVEGTMTLSRWNGTVSTYYKAFYYLPELRLKHRGDGMNHGEVIAVRKRRTADGTAWPFSEDAADALQYLDR